jgi:predicted AAA+ superfamily ATPase
VVYLYPRKEYLNKLISKKDNGRIKIITGLRRSGKSVLLFQLYHEWLLGEGIREDLIIALDLDILENVKSALPVFHPFSYK